MLESILFGVGDRAILTKVGNPTANSSVRFTKHGASVLCSGNRQQVIEIMLKREREVMLAQSKSYIHSSQTSTNCSKTAFVLL